MYWCLLSFASDWPLVILGQITLDISVIMVWTLVQIGEGTRSVMYVMIMMIGSGVFGEQRSAAPNPRDNPVRVRVRAGKYCTFKLSLI